MDIYEKREIKSKKEKLKIAYYKKIAFKIILT